MADPTIAQKGPYGKGLEAGKYFWCACGLSKNQPFCDASHKGTEFKSVIFELESAKTVWLCGCKHTENKPFCDGTHKRI